MKPNPSMLDRRRIASFALGLLLLFAPTAANAHHILGVPHYSYDEDYPQTPVLTYRVDAGEYDVKMTGYPGKVEPGQRCSLHLYIHHRVSGKLFDAPVTMTVTRDRLFMTDPVIYGPMPARLDERIYKFHPHFEDEGEYRVMVEFEAAGAPWSIEMPLVVGEPRSPIVALGVSAWGLGLFVLVVRAIKIKRNRRGGSPRYDTGRAVSS